jgi:hypothetical protein
MQTPLNPGEIVVREGLANATRGAENVGGKLYLTTSRLIFESHALNVQTGSTVLSLDQITAWGTGRALVLNLFRLTPNMFYVDTDQGRYEFVVYGRRKWKQALDAQKVATAQSK